jgi:hypothetical protein
MAAACLLCRFSIPHINVAIGKGDTPIGVCRKCDSLCCGEHGDRDKSPAFLCIMCDANLQTASAAWRAWVRAGGLTSWRSTGVVTGGASSAAGAAGAAGGGGDLLSALVLLFPPGTALSDLVVDSLEGWGARRPRFEILHAALKRMADELVAMIDALVASRPDRSPPADSRSVSAGGQRFGADDVTQLWRALDPESKRLLAAAIVLTRLLMLDPARLPEPVAAIVAFTADLSLKNLDGWRRDAFRDLGHG